MTTREEGEIGSKSREEGEIVSESREMGDSPPVPPPSLRTSWTINEFLCLLSKKERISELFIPHCKDQLLT